MTPPASPRPKAGLALQLILFACLAALFMLPGAFIVAGCTGLSESGDTEESLKQLTEDQKKDLGLNADQINQLNQIQSKQISGNAPAAAPPPPAPAPAPPVPPAPAPAPAPPVPPGPAPAPAPPVPPGPAPAPAPPPLPCI